jgi:hypothetical protein
MSTKNIARTAIEGGRTASYKREVHIEKRSERAQARDELRRILKDVEAADERPFPVRKDVMKDFADKLHPAYRWLSKKAIGMTAEEIRGLLMTRFDTRTLAGRHLVFDHLMPRPSYSYAERRMYWSAPVYLRYANFDFNEEGRLQDMGRRSGRKKTPKKLRIRARQWIGTIHEHHRIGEKNGVYFVFEQTDAFHDAECLNSWCRDHYREYRNVDGAWRYVRCLHPAKILNGSEHVVPFHNVRAYRPVRMLALWERELWLTNPVRQLDLVQNP